MRRAYNPDTGQVWVWDEFSKEWRQETGAQQAARETPSGQAALISAGRELSDWGRTLARPFVGLSHDPGADEAMAALREASPYATMAGAAAPSLATGGIGLTGLAGRSVAGMMLEQGAVSALTGGLSNPEEPLYGAAVGGGLGVGGYLGGQMAGRVAASVRQVYAQARAQRMAAMMASTTAQDAEGMLRAGGGADMPFGRAARGYGIAEGLPEDAHLGAAGATGRGYAQMIADADRLGFPLTPGERWASKPMRQFEAARRRSPFSSGAFEEMGKVRQTIVNDLTARAMGQEFADLSPVGLGRTADHLASVFETTAKAAGRVSLDEPLIARNLDDIVAAASEGSTKAPKVVAAVEGLRELVDGSGRITGARLMEERARMVRAQKGLVKQGEHTEADGLGDIIETVDLALERSLAGKGQLGAGKGAARLEAFRQARQAWRLLTNVEKAVTPQGDVLPGALFQRLRQDYGRTVSRGLETARMGERIGDLVAALRVASGARDIMGDSGTATAMAVQGLSIGGLLEAGARKAVTEPLTRAYLRGGPGMQAAVGTGLLGSAAASPAVRAGGQAGGWSSSILSRSLGLL
jgi:hypothetical protein